MKKTIYHAVIIPSNAPAELLAPIQAYLHQPADKSFSWVFSRKVEQALPFYELELLRNKADKDVLKIHFPAGWILAIVESSEDKQLGFVGPS